MSEMLASFKDPEVRVALATSWRLIPARGRSTGVSVCVCCLRQADATAWLSACPPARQVMEKAKEMLNDPEYMKAARKKLAEMQRKAHDAGDDESQRKHNPNPSPSPSPLRCVVLRSGFDS